LAHDEPDIAQLKMRVDGMRGAADFAGGHWLSKHAHNCNALPATLQPSGVVFME
jgi:hypothetical protein